VTQAKKHPKVGLVQSEAGSMNKKVNVERAVAGIHDAAGRGATLVCLQELFAGPYFCQVEDAALFDLAEPIPGETSDAVARAAAKAKVTVVASLFERRAAGVYHNTAVIYGPDGKELSRYRKMHIPDDPQYYEKFYFTPGDLGFVACPTEAGVVGTLVCWDQWYPEAARLTALRGAEILCYPTAIGWLPRDKAEFGEAQLAAWQTIQRSHAIANGVFVVAVNRVGKEAMEGAEIEFWGRSFVCDPGGTIIAEAGSGEEVLVVECDLGKIEQTRRGWPFLRDRRIDAFGDLSRRWIGRDE
jgi:N-carbamoylputrescine amidase